MQILTQKLENMRLDCEKEKNRNKLLQKQLDDADREVAEYQKKVLALRAEMERPVQKQFLAQLEQETAQEPQQGAAKMSALEESHRQLQEKLNALQNDYQDAIKEIGGLRLQAKAHEPVQQSDFITQVYAENEALKKKLKVAEYRLTESQGSSFGAEKYQSLIESREKEIGQLRKQTQDDRN